MNPYEAAHKGKLRHILFLEKIKFVKSPTRNGS